MKGGTWPGTSGGRVGAGAVGGQGPTGGFFFRHDGGLCTHVASAPTKYVCVCSTSKL